jgi:hypothetical protein
MAKDGSVVDTMY